MAPTDMTSPRPDQAADMATSPEEMSAPDMSNTGEMGDATDMSSGNEDMPAAMDMTDATDMPPAQPLGFEIAPGDHRGEFTSGGRARTYTLRLPPGYDPEGTHPLLFVFHGGNGSGDQIKMGLGFDAYTDEGETLAVYPDGVENNWADGRGTTDTSLAGVDDVAFVRELIDHLSTHLAVDRARVWVTGVSNGGLMSHRLGCDLADRIAAIAPVIASMASAYTDACAPARPISMLAIQGTLDPFMTFEGGDSSHDARPNLGDGGPILGVIETAEYWARLMMCEETPTITALEPLDPSDPTRVERRLWDMCAQSAIIDYYIVEGMGHTWPPRQSAVPRISGPASSQLDATALIWAFFQDKRLP